MEDLKTLMALIGRDPTNFGEHSGRRGGATTASEAGVSWIDLKRHGRWASNSAPQRYIEDTQKRTNKVPNILLQSAKDNNNNARTRRNESPPRRNILVQSIKDNNNARTRPDESPPRKSARRALYQEDKKSDRSEGITNAVKHNVKIVTASSMWPESYYLPAFNTEAVGVHPTGVYAPFRKPTFVQRTSRGKACDTAARQTMTVRVETNKDGGATAETGTTFPRNVAETLRRSGVSRLNRTSKIKRSDLPRRNGMTKIG